MFKEILAYTQTFFSNGSKVILGLSGGPDSVFLLYALSELKKQGSIELVAAHLDHQWRENSAADALFCKKICEALDIPFISEKASHLAIDIKSNGSQEEVGRKLRRFFFEKIAGEKQANFIALAHHRQDQQETFLMRLIRGSSISGLCSMKAIDGLYLRPLLHINKDEIVHYLDKHTIEYLHDPTNTSDMFLRNRIRSQVIPGLRMCDNRFDAKFDSTINHLRQEDNFLQKLTQETFDKIFIFDQPTNIYVGKLTQLKLLDPVLQRRTILIWLIKEKIPFAVSNTFIQEIMRFINSSRGGSHIIGTNIVVYKKQKTCWIENKRS